MESDNECLETLLQIINRVHVAMMTTTEPADSLRSRPLATLRTEEFDGFLWFYTAADSPKIAEIGEHHQVNLSYADPAHHLYASVSGQGVVVRDAEKMAERWNPLVKAWFPNGLDDPNLVLLQVSVDKAEYWDASGTPVKRLAAFKKALATGDTSDLVENRKLRLVPPSS
jgi:general stress protein 26